MYENTAPMHTKGEMEGKEQPKDQIQNCTV